jgi:Regulator of chromosome condensation (RCC1) repeat
MNCILFACPGPPIITCRWVTHVDPSPEYFPEVPARSRAVVMARVSAASSTYSYQACVITASGGILCQPVNAGMFRPLAGLDAGLVAVDPGRTHACSLDASGRARCWGSNASGALGDPAISVSDPPGVTGSGLASGVTGIGAGADFSCALKSSGEVLCWGSNTFGQLGDGTTTSRPVPGAVRWQGDARVGALSGMWMNPAEPGWGVSLTQHRDVVFAVLYTYDAAGDPRWLVAPECRLTGLACPSCVAGSSCAGALYDARGPRLDRFDPGAVTLTPAGQMRLSFSSEAAGVLGYDAGGVSRSTAITRFVFGAGSSPTAVDYTDHWYNPSEPGWGIALTQQSDLMFVVWFSYDEARMPVWYVASACRAARRRVRCSMPRGCAPRRGAP